jgi:hypothetical protein
LGEAAAPLCGSAGQPVTRCGSRRSLRLRTHELSHLGPLLGFVREELAEIGGPVRASELNLRTTLLLQLFHSMLLIFGNGRSKRHGPGHMNLRQGNNKRSSCF